MASFSRLFKTEAKEKAKLGMTTKFSIVTSFAQDKNGQVIGVEKYGDYGLQEWKVEPGEKDE
jgi:hypothetical protein